MCGDRFVKKGERGLWYDRLNGVVLCSKKTSHLQRRCTCLPFNLCVPLCNSSSECNVLGKKTSSDIFCILCLVFLLSVYVECFVGKTTDGQRVFIISVKRRDYCESFRMCQTFFLFPLFPSAIKYLSLM